MSNMSAAKKQIHKFYNDLAETLKSYIDLGPYNKMFLKVIDDMNAKEFEAYMVKIENKDRFLEVLIPVSTGKRFPEEKVIKLIRKYDGEPFCQLEVKDDITGETFITPEKYWIAFYNKRRQIQTMESKVSLPDTNKVRDNLTGAVTGTSKGSSISSVQITAMLGRGMVGSSLELVKARGGDLAVSREMNKALSENGTVSLNTLLKIDSRPESTDTLALRWTCMHIEHNL